MYQMLALFAVASLLPYHSEIAEWQPVLTKLCERTDEFRRLLRHPTDHLADRWLASAGLLRGEAGAGIEAINAGTRIVGEKGALIVLFLPVSQPEKTYPAESCLALFETKGTRVVASVLDIGLGDEHEPQCPDYAAKVGDLIVLSGMDRWEGTGASAVGESFRRVGAGWVEIGRAVPEFQCDVAPPLRFAPDGKSLLPVKVQGRTYPANTSPSHAGARYAYEAQWSFPGGIVRNDWSRVMDTAYNRFDDLLGVLKAGQKDEVRRRCLNEAVFRHVWALRDKVGDPGDLSEPDSEVFGLQNVGIYFHFVRDKDRWVVSKLTPMPK